MIYTTIYLITLSLKSNKPDLCRKIVLCSMQFFRNYTFIHVFLFNDSHNSDKHTAISIDDCVCMWFPSMHMYACVYMAYINFYLFIYFSEWQKWFGRVRKSKWLVFLQMIVSANLWWYTSTYHQLICFHLHVNLKVRVSFKRDCKLGFVLYHLNWFKMVILVDFSSSQS